MKPVILAFGNCQPLALYSILMDIPAILDRYDLHYLPSDAVLGSTAFDPALVPRCAVVWEQVGVSQRLPFRDALPDGVRRIRFPELSFPLLWPMNCIDPRNVPDPPRTWGDYPYGDRMALALMEEGLHGPAGHAAWMERGEAFLPPMQRLLDMEMARARRRSAEVDVEPMELILQLWRTQRLFSTLNHPSNHVLWLLFDLLLEQSFPGWTPPADEIGAARTRFLNPVLGSGKVDMDWFQVPVHPMVAEAFGLSWCTDETLYRCDLVAPGAWITREAYMADYYMRPAG